MNGGCSPPNPFGNTWSVCNMGEQGGGCETDIVCQPGLTCENVLSLLGLISIDTCSPCSIDADCNMGEICTPLVDVAQWQGSRDCITPGSLAPDSYCDLNGNGDQACASGICSVVDIMGLTEVGACGSCNVDADCVGNSQCISGEFDLNTGTLTGSYCL